MHVSVVIPAFNVSPFIGETLSSVLSQTHRFLTVHVIDDGSTDGTGAAVGRFRDPRVHLVSQPNAGVSSARNRGLAAARGEAVLFLDADDVLVPDALARLTRCLARNPRAVAAAAPFRVFAGAAGRSRGTARRARRTPRGVLLPGLLERNPFANGGHVLVRREAAVRVGGFRPGIVYGEDWEFWIRLALLGPFAAVWRGGPALLVRERPGSAYRGMAGEPASFQPCMNAIFANPALHVRFGAARLARARHRAEAENAWIVGRELVRHGRRTEGRAFLARSLLRKPSPRRALLFVAACALPLLPETARGPFRSYAAAG